MAIGLTQDVAQKLVETVKDVCGHDINYIDPKGIILASTRKSRIGTFHEIGRKAAESGDIIEVMKDDDYLGTKKGVNIPFFYKRELVAVIGISGDPDKVRSYAYLVQRIAILMLKERELEAQDHGRRNEIHYFMRSLVEHQPMEPEYIKEFMHRRKLSLTDSYQMVVIRMDGSRRVKLSMVEEHIYRIFDQIPDSLYIFNYPKEFWLMVNTESCERNLFRLEKLAKMYAGIFLIGIGTSEMLSGLYRSYKSALIAIQSAGEEKNIISYDDLTLDILLGNLDEDAKTRYKNRTIATLEKEDLDFLKIYFASNLSLQKTAEKLFIHKNTVQYKLNRIHTLTGLNPRAFEEAVVLYLAAVMDQIQPLS
ncbi:MAG: helix-turn-helix domain-containing protein [Lachnospiraceae bacterium]|nr:helix-turn-helix domain-containing protein [Lachnospiraceae bacterium]